MYNFTKKSLTTSKITKSGSSEPTNKLIHVEMNYKLLGIRETWEQIKGLCW